MHTDGNANLAVEMGVLKYSHPKYYAKRAASNHASSPEGQSARGSQSSAPAASETKPKGRSRHRDADERRHRELVFR
jgi:hypothetical protein